MRQRLKNLQKERYFMKQWVLSVAGIAILTVLADVILPGGQTRKYIKTVIGIVVTLVLVQPLLSFTAGGKYSFSLTEQEIEPQQQYISYVEYLEGQDAENLKNELVRVGFFCPTVTFDAKSRTNTVVFSEKYSAELQKKAQLAAEAAKPKHFVKFVWNNTELQ